MDKTRICQIDKTSLYLGSGLSKSAPILNSQSALGIAIGDGNNVLVDIYWHMHMVILANNLPVKKGCTVEQGIHHIIVPVDLPCNK